MKEPELVAECLNKMINSCNIPVTAKTRIGVDNIEEFDYLNKFVGKIKEAGCKTVILHARKAILKGLTPKQNLSVPKLNYEMVHKIKNENPELEIIINGGISNIEQIHAHLLKCDGVMIGRAAYRTPYVLTEMARRIFGRIPPRRDHVALAMAEYAETTTKTGVPLHSITRHMLGLYAGQPGAKYWRRQLGENARKAISPGGLIRETSALCEELAARRAA